MCARCQHQATATTERVLLTDLHVELRSLFCHFSETGRLTSSCVEYVPPTLRGNCGKNCAYYSQIFTVFRFHTDYTLTSTQQLIIEKYIKKSKTI